MNGELDAAAVAARRCMQRAAFRVSVPEARLLPADSGREVVFAGRSNSGKSSAINALCNQRQLARTSRTPGRTQHLVVFDIDADRRLIDLPGFGYAKVPKGMRALWEKTLPRYLETRQALIGVVLLMDVRHVLRPVEQQLLGWCSESGVSAHILLNKSDKLSRGAAQSARLEVERYIKQNSLRGASVQLFSALRFQGLEQAWTVIGEWLSLEDKADPGCGAGGSG